jgi:hypothetical protein
MRIKSAAHRTCGCSASTSRMSSRSRSIPNSGSSASFVIRLAARGSGVCVSTTPECAAEIDDQDIGLGAVLQLMEEEPDRELAV